MDLTNESKNKLLRITAQFVFLFSGVFSTCAAQYVYYQGAGDQRALIMPLCNYLGMMLVGLVPSIKLPGYSDEEPTLKEEHGEKDAGPIDNDATLAAEEENVKLLCSSTSPNHDDGDLLLRRQSPCLGASAAAPTAPPPPRGSNSPAESDTLELIGNEADPSVTAGFQLASTLQMCVLLNVFLDFAGCVFCNVGLSMAGSGIYQVIYSSVVCWSALMSHTVMKKIVRRNEWIGIATVTFGLAFSAVGESADGKDASIVLMGSLNTLIGAGFYGATYVTGEFTLNLPEKPSPRELCVSIGTTCVGVIAVYMMFDICAQMFYALPNWNELITIPVLRAKGDSLSIVLVLFSYTVSQLVHSLTYFMLLGSLGAVTTGIMQSLRAVLVFALSSFLFCAQQTSQCYDTKRGVATLVVVVGVLFYSWAKGQAQGRRRYGPRRKWIGAKNLVV